MKKITLWLFLLIVFASNAQIGIIQSFPTTTTPAGWNLGAGSLTTTQSCATAAWRKNNYSTSTTGILTSDTQVSNGANLTISFDYKVVDWSAATTATSPFNGTITTQVSLDNGATWTLSAGVINNTNHVVANTCATVTYVVPGASVPAGSNVKIRWNCVWGTSGDYYVYIDNISATQPTTTPPNCTVLSSPANGAVNVSSSTITWNSATGIPTGYRLNVGTTPGGTQLLNMFDAGNVLSYNLGVLAPGTTYYVTVIPYNANGDATGCTESSFTTCGPNTVYPYMEQFTSFLPNNCWYKADNGDLTAGPATFVGSNWTQDQYLNTGTTLNSFKYNMYTTGDNDWVITQEFSIPTTGYELKYDAALTQWNSTTAPTTPWDAGDAVEVLISNGLTNWTVLRTFDNANTPPASGLSYVEDLDAYAGQTVRFAFRAVTAATDGGDDTDFFVDYINVRLSPTCPDQTGLIVGTVTATTVDFSWDDTSGAGAVGYEYAVTTSATPPASGTAIATTFNSVSSLAPQTLYYIHVRSVCSGGLYGNWTTASFTTLCASITTLPWTEGFEGLTTVGTTNFPSCWSKENGGWESRNSNDTFSTARTGTKFIRNAWSATNEYIWTPGFDLVAGTSYDFSSFIQGDNADSWVVDYFVNTVQNSTGATPIGTTYNVPGTNSGYAAQSYNKVAATFVPSTSGTYYFAVRVNEATGNPWYVSFDDFKLEITPTCLEPVNLTSSNVTATGADLSWDAMVGSVGYEYVVTTSATPPASGTATTNTFAQPTGLTPQTVYYLHVRTDCGSGAYSTWATYTFTTACAPITTLPWTEGFEGLTTVGANNFPSCWYKENGGWESRNSNDTFSTSNTGTKFIRDAWSATNEYMWTPGFDLVAGTSYDFSSFIQGDNGNSWVVDYFVNTAQNSTGATQIGTTYNVPGTGTTYAAQAYNKVTATFVPATSGTYYFAVRVNESTGNPWYVSFDDFELKLTPATPPSCATGLTATPDATCGNFASTLSWTAEPLATGYYVTIGTTSGGSDIANAVPVSVTSYSFSGLNNTQYFWKVVPYNGAGSATGCAEQSFTTAVNGCYCSSVPSSVDNLGITNVVLGATPYTIAPVTYVDNTATPEIIAPGATANLQLTFSTGYTYDINVWIDFNNDFDFDDAGELVKTGIACTNVEPNTVDASFTMPLTAPSGPHRMRIGSADFGQVPPAPCYNGSYGVTLDFTVDTSLATSSFDLSNFVAYPNPVKDVLNLSYSTAITNVKVTNLLGQQVMTKNVNDTNVQVNMSDLSAGAYIVTISSGDMIHTIKVVKQ
ncbi:Protein of unknown function precursor; putative adhesin [Flavobacterium indicum GPTSA100-9 = DSM 17447]|uniref:Fibronectin type-III domain-containing protein n=1 Tax=Flavobacterium indicum (strain DSM 17447 / CIP 109464 / GPTSA100-9) TaxID=1094466 RepID=H8XUN0_FLAIG|nr:GEVED domain-containing protein [Flavobacterium indicum]CCG53808.1 Protein of unknown function precursor; putative adhesin [Flavobacterium indicum GPTSA100-9 = DSM 17447]